MTWGKLAEIWALREAGIKCETLLIAEFQARHAFPWLKMAEIERMCKQKSQAFFVHFRPA